MYVYYFTSADCTVAPTPEVLDYDIPNYAQQPLQILDRRVYGVAQSARWKKTPSFHLSINKNVAFHTQLVYAAEGLPTRITKTLMQNCLKLLGQFWAIARDSHANFRSGFSLLSAFSVSQSDAAFLAHYYAYHRSHTASLAMSLVAGWKDSKSESCLLICGKLHVGLVFNISPVTVCG